MSLDPRQDIMRQAASDPTARLEARIAEFERKFAAQRNRPIMVGDGAPTIDPTTLTEGTEYLDRMNLRKYYVVAAAWHYVALT